MKIRSCSRCVPSLMVIAALLIAGPVLRARLYAAEPDPKAQSEPIRITSDKLVTDNQKRTAVFSGHVTAVQGDTKLTADRLTIFYKSLNGEPSNGASDIEHLEAQGQVRIAFDNKLAVSNQAVYIIEERKLTLEGPQSKVVSGQDEVSGSRITFFRNEGRMIIESDHGKQENSHDNQVKAVIHSDQRGLN
jgi:lipopolysaccharide export system protein LptA